MGTAYLLLGSNLGNKEDNLNFAFKSLKKIGEIKKYSAIYETEPWGFSDSRNFFNMAVCIETSLNPYELLNEILKIEILAGRKKQSNQWVAREIDIDIIFYNDSIINEKHLIIPHPQLIFRKFVLVPLNEITPDFIHPVLGKSICKLLTECTDKSKVDYMHIPVINSIIPI